MHGQAIADTSLLAFRDPDSFCAGHLHKYVAAWQRIAAVAPYPETSKVVGWIKDGVCVHDFFQPFRGAFKGHDYDSALPPPVIFDNSVSCQPFAQFISDTILARLASGAISVWGKVGLVDPPHLVMPLTVEPTKPRLCNDNRFLNLWIKDTPFKLDSLQHLTRYVSMNSFQTVCDNKSGYDHIMLTLSSRTFFGFQWAGWYFVSNTIPFGWKSSAYVYHTTGLLVSHYFRSISIPCSLYIDDRHSGELLLSNAPAYSRFSSFTERSFARASSACFIVCFHLVNLGYFLGVDKSILVPRQAVPYLGFLVDSTKLAFLLLEAKRKKFLDLLHVILSSSLTDLKALQRLAGKCNSFTLAVPGARLYTNEINRAISKATRSSRPIPMTGSLKQEIRSWDFLQSWQGYLPWRSETHHQLLLCSDASAFAWAGVLSVSAKSLVVRDYWPDSHFDFHINIKEVLALVNVLSSFSHLICDAWVDVFTDSLVLVSAWSRQGSKSHALSDALKQLFTVVMSSNINLHLFHIKSDMNPADSPSRKLSLQDCRLSATAWDTVQVIFGGVSGHTVDLMTLSSNVQCSRDGAPLPFFSPHPVPGSAAVNVFAQLPSLHLALFFVPYAFPPIILIPQLLRFLASHAVRCTLVVPDLRPRRFWWPLLQGCKSVQLGSKGSLDVILAPTSSGFSPFPLPWDLWAFRLDSTIFSVYNSPDTMS